MKKMLIPFLVYLIVCIIAVILPAADGYDTIGWKLLIGQIYAIPLFISAIVITLVLDKVRSKK